MGKTYFIEKLLKLLIDKNKNVKEVENAFERMIIIDAWKFSNSKNIPLEFENRLSEILLKLNMEPKTIKQSEKKFKKAVEKIVKILFFSIEVNLGIFKFKPEKPHNKKSLEYEKKIEEAIKKVQNNEKKTVIFIDNLERLGPDLWDLLKSIIKLQAFPNYFIILPMNINGIQNNKKDDASEYPIEKYVDIPIYNFKHDYFRFFIDHFNEADAHIMDSIFSEEINGTKLTIREIEQAINKNNVQKQKEIYENIKIIYTKIWSASDEISKFLIEKLKVFINCRKEQYKIIYQIYNLTFKKMIYGHLDFEEPSKPASFSNVFDWKRNTSVPFNWKINYKKDIKNIIEFICKNIEKNETEINVNKKQHECEIKNIDDIQKAIDAQEKNIKDYEKKKNEEKNKGTKNIDPTIISTQEHHIKIAKELILNENEKKQKAKENKDEIKNLLSKLNDRCKILKEMQKNVEKHFEEYKTLLRSMKQKLTWIEIDAFNNYVSQDLLRNNGLSFENNSKEDILSGIQRYNNILYIFK